MRKKDFFAEYSTIEEPGTHYKRVRAYDELDAEDQVTMAESADGNTVTDIKISKIKY